MRKSMSKINCFHKFLSKTRIELVTEKTFKSSNFGGQWGCKPICNALLCHRPKMRFRIVSEKIIQRSKPITRPNSLYFFFYNYQSSYINIFFVLKKVVLESGRSFISFFAVSRPILIHFRNWNTGFPHYIRYQEQSKWFACNEYKYNIEQLGMSSIKIVDKTAFNKSYLYN